MDDLHMWSYWAEKKGVIEALEDYFPQTLANDSSLQLALHTIKANLALINSIMSEKESEAQDGE